MVSITTIQEGINMMSLLKRELCHGALHCLNACVDSRGVSCLGSHCAFCQLWLDHTMAKLHSLFSNTELHHGKAQILEQQC